MTDKNKTVSKPKAKQKEKITTSKKEVTKTKVKPNKTKKTKNKFLCAKIKVNILEVISISIIVLVIGLLSGYLIGNKNKSIQSMITKSSKLEEFVDTYNYILNNYYGEEITEDELLKAALEGILSTLDDPNSIYMNENESENFNITLEGSYEGLGIEITNELSTNNILVVNVFEGSPAYNAGILKGDKILKVNDEDVSTQSITYFSNKIKYGTESDFKLIVERNGSQIELQVKRGGVVLESVTSKIFERNNKKIGYMYISIFANNTYEQFKTKLEELESQQIDSLILDFRDNSGGHMYTARKILSLFLDSSYVVYQTQDKSGTVKTYSEGNITKKYKIALLGNFNSASSSEIVIAGLKDNLDAKLIGTKTYGKGTVQELRTLPDGTQYKFTIKKWLTPNGICIDEIGIEPDYEVFLDFNYVNNPSDDTDNQLQKALEILQ